MKSKIISLALILVVLLGVSMPSMALTGTLRTIEPRDITASTSSIGEVDSISENIFAPVGIIGGIMIALGIVVVVIPVIIIVIVVKNRSKKENIKDKKEEKE